jgi:preprotein translocase SecE subunit
VVDKKQPAKKGRKAETVRERAAKAQIEQPRRIRSTAGKLKTPFSRARNLNKKEYHIPLPENRLGRILRKRVRIMPKFVRDAWAEVKLVSWPNRKDTLRLTMAVFIFSVIFGVFVGVLDYGLDKLFKKFILG